MFLSGTANYHGYKKRKTDQPDSARRTVFSGQDLAAICAFKATTALVEVDVVDWKGGPLVVWTIIIHYQHNFHQHNEIERWSPMRWVSVCIDQADTNHTLPLKNKLSAGWMAKRVSSMSKWVSGVDRVMPWFNVKNLKRVGVWWFFAQNVILRFNLIYFDIFEDTWISKINLNHQFSQLYFLKFKATSSRQSITLNLTLLILSSFSPGLAMSIVEVGWWVLHETCRMWTTNCMLHVWHARPWKPCASVGFGSHLPPVNRRFNLIGWWGKN